MSKKSRLRRFVERVTAMESKLGAALAGQFRVASASERSDLQDLILGL